MYKEIYVYLKEKKTDTFENKKKKSLKIYGIFLLHIKVIIYI